MRILLLNSNSQSSHRTPSAHTHGVASALLRAGHLVDCAVCTTAGHAELAPLQSRGLTLHMLAAPAGRDSLDRLFGACRPDVVIERLAPLAPFGAEAAAHFGAVHVYELAEPIEPTAADDRRRNGNDDFAACLRRGFAASRGAVSLTPEALAWIRPLVPGEFEVIGLPKGAGAETLEPAAPARRKWAEALIGARPGEFTIGFSGTFRPWYDLDTLVLAAERVRANIPVRLVLIGDGPGRNALLELTIRRHTPAVFAGTLDAHETRALLECCDVIAVPYARVGVDLSPLKLVEAMAAGRPIVATETGATRRVLVEGGSGLLVPPGDAVAMAHAFEKLTTQPELREKLADAARRRATQHYSWDVVAERLLAFAGARRSSAEHCA